MSCNIICVQVYNVVIQLFYILYSVYIYYQIIGEFLCYTAYPCCLKFKMNSLKYNEILSSIENHCKLQKTEIAECFLSLQGCSKLEINLLKKKQENRIMDMGKGEERVRCMERVTWKLTLPYVKRQPMGIGCMAQETQTGALYQPRGMGQGRRWEGVPKGRGYRYTQV